MGMVGTESIVMAPRFGYNVNQKFAAAFNEKSHYIHSMLKSKLIKLKINFFLKGKKALLHYISATGFWSHKKRREYYVLQHNCTRHSTGLG